MLREGSPAEVGVDLILEGRSPLLPRKGGLGEKIQETLRWQVEKPNKRTLDNWIPVHWRQRSYAEKEEANAYNNDLFGAISIIKEIIVNRQSKN